MSKPRPTYFAPCDICGTIMLTTGMKKYCSDGCKKRLAVARSTEYFRTNPEVRRRAQRKRNTGWTDDEYKTALDAQGGVCAICEKPCFKSLSADHDHNTGAKRALLCSRCNQAIGLLRDDPDICSRAAQYLDNYKDQPI